MASVTRRHTAVMCRLLMRIVAVALYVHIVKTDKSGWVSLVPADAGVGTQGETVSHRRGFTCSAARPLTSTQFSPRTRAMTVSTPVHLRLSSMRCAARGLLDDDTGEFHP